MTALFFAFCGVVTFLLLALAAFEVVADRWAAYVDGAQAELDPADLRDQPEPVWPGELPPLEQRRLVSVPAQRPRHLHAVRDDSLTSAEWARLLRAVDGGAS